MKPQCDSVPQKHDENAETSCNESMMRKRHVRSDRENTKQPRVDNYDPCRPDHFLILPDEIVVKILSYLTTQTERFSQADIARVSRVSRRFRDLCLDPSLWKVIRIPCKEHMDLQTANQLLERSTKLEILYMEYRRDCVDIACHALQCCPRLNNLRVRGQIKEGLESLLKTIGTHGASLRLLQLQGDGRPKVMESNAESLKNITRLNLENYVGVDGSALRAIGDHCGGLVRVHINVAWYIADEAMDYFLKRVKGTLRHLALTCSKSYMSGTWYSNIGACQQLDTLHIGNNVPLQARDMRSISKVTNLKSLVIENAGGLCDMDCIVAFTKLTNLTHLRMKQCRGIGDKGLRQIVDGCAGLERLHVGSMDLTDSGVKYLLLMSARLKELTLSLRGEFGMEAFAYIPPQLRFLGLVREFLDHRRHSVDEAFLAELMNRNPGLEATMSVDSADVFND